MAANGVARTTHDNVVREGAFVVWDVSGDRQSFVEVKRNGKVKLGKLWCSTEPLIGATYGTAFEAAPDSATLRPRAVREPWSDATATERDNAQLVDNGRNQGLSAEDIAALKSGGARGEDIIAALASSSATFAGKTEFSQEKYKRKKAKKYCAYGVVRRTTARSVTEAYFMNQPAKIYNLRVDTLSLLLSYANVGAHSNAIVLDGCSGLVVAAVAERMGGTGHLLALSTASKPPQLDVLRLLNLSSSQMEGISWATLPQLISAQQQLAHAAAAAAQTASETTTGVTDLPAETAGITELPAKPVPATAESSMAQPACSLGAVATNNSLPAGGLVASTTAGVAEDMLVDPSTPAGRSSVAARGAPTSAHAGNKLRRVPRRAEDSALGSLLSRGFDCCLVAAPQLESAAVLRALLPLLPPGTPFVVYNCYSQPLAEALLELQTAKAAVCLHLHESWMREYQVLPSRTHPHMSASGTGGFFLAGTTVEPAKAAPVGGALASTRPGARFKRPRKN